MKYTELRKLYDIRNQVFSQHNGANGTTTDNSVDAVITRDPNDYLMPKINSLTLLNGLQLTIAVLAIIIMVPLAIKSIKSFL